MIVLRLPYSLLSSVSLWPPSPLPGSQHPFAHTSAPYNSALAKHLQVASDHPLSQSNLSLKPSLCTHTHTPCTHTERTTNTSTSTNTRTNTQTHAPSTHTNTGHAHIHARAQHEHIQAPSTRAQQQYYIFLKSRKPQPSRSPGQRNSSNEWFDNALCLQHGLKLLQYFMGP